MNQSRSDDHTAEPYEPDAPSVDLVAMTEASDPTNDEHESSALAEALTRLGERFPNIDADVIEAAVRPERARQRPRICRRLRMQ